MMRNLLVIAALVFGRGVVAATCTIDAKVTLPASLEPLATSFCHDVLQTTTAAPKTVPTSLTSFLSTGTKLSSYCSCMLDYPATTTTTKHTPSHSAKLSKAAVTVTSCVSKATITLPASTVTIPASTITLPASTITLVAHTVTVTTTTGLASCTPAAQPPAGAMCGFNAINGGGNIFLLSPSPNTAPSLSACMQQCLSFSSCLSVAFDGTNCGLYSQTTTQLELDGIIFPVNPGVAGSTVFYDTGCLVCPAIKRKLARREGDMGRREADVKRREAELERRMLAVVERERKLESLS